MSEKTKFNLEYGIENGFRIAEGFAASHVMLARKYFLDNNNWKAVVDWANGNFQEIYLNYSSGNQWVDMINPGPAGIYYLLLRKGHPSTFRAFFGNGAVATNIEWLDEPWSDEYLINMAVGSAVLITLFWDGAKYTGYIIPKTPKGRIPKSGYLYNWYAVNSGKLEIPGWHIPSDMEIGNLVGTLVSSPGHKLKAEPPLFDGIDQYGFRALPTGRREETGYFLGGTTLSHFWTSTQADSLNAYAPAVHLSLHSFGTSSHHKKRGLSVRLIRNSLSGYVAGEKVQDADGNIYDTQQIYIELPGPIIYNQIWLKQNLATTRYNDGVGIPYLTSDSHWSATNQGAICAYNNILNNIFE